MKKYFRYSLSDIPAAIVVFLVALPLCLGISLASKVPEFSGIIGGVIGGLVVGFLSKSPLSVSGPAAGLTAIVASGVMTIRADSLQHISFSRLPENLIPHIPPNILADLKSGAISGLPMEVINKIPPELMDHIPLLGGFFLAVVIAGILQILMGAFRLGIIGDYVPNSVIKGMLAAIGIILILKQIPHLVGYDKDPEGDESFMQMAGDNTFSGIVNSLNHVTPIAVLIGVVSIGILLLYETSFFKKKKIFKIISGPLLVVVTGVIIFLLSRKAPNAYALDAEQVVNVPVAASAQQFLSFFQFPDLSFLSNLNMWKLAFTLALVASLETLLSIEAVDKLDTYKRVTPPNRELIAQGSGNMVSGLLGGLPLTSVIVRSSANVYSGAQSKMSTIFHGALLLLSVMFIPEVLNLIPKSALAAILIFTGFKLASPKLIRTQFRKGWEDFLPFAITIVAIVATDLLKGVLIGLAAGIIFVIRSNFKSSFFVMKDGDNYLFRLKKDVSFLTKPQLKHKLEQVPENGKVLIDITQADFIDRDIVETVNDFMKHAPLKNISVSLKKHSNRPYHDLFNEPEKE